jgi:predicted chitinase
MIGVDLVANPELLEDPEVSVKAAIAYFTKGKDSESLPNFKNEGDAINYFADLNAGSTSERARRKARQVSPNFQLKV